MTLHFLKYHGLGNDFIVLHGPDLPPEVPLDLLARRMCDRHFGVGADGLLIWADAEHADARMIVMNSDGSRPEMCGNGIRCFALHLQRTLGPRRTFVIDTDAGVRYCDMGERDGQVVVTVNMGRADFRREACLVPPDFGGGNSLDPVEVVMSGERIVLRLASMGNPHAVCIVRDPLVDLDAAARAFGRRISTHAAFSRGVNVEWIRQSPDGLELVVYERGSGLTMACGTGACAAVAVAHRAGLVDLSREVAVDLPGGRLWIALEPSGGGPEPTSGPIAMTGAASFVYAGGVPPDSWIRQHPDDPMRTLW